MSEVHNFNDSYSSGELGVQLLKRLIINGLSETMTEFISLEEAHAIEQIQRKKDMSGIDCYIEMKTQTGEHNINPVQIKTEYAVNTFIEIVSQIHLDKNKVKIGYALDNQAQSKYTFFVNYSHGVAIADTKKLTSLIQEECLEYAVNNGEKFGIWGGLSERERRAIRKKRGIVIRELRFKR